MKAIILFFFSGLSVFGLHGQVLGGRSSQDQPTRLSFLFRALIITQLSYFNSITSVVHVC